MKIPSHFYWIFCDQYRLGVNSAYIECPEISYVDYMYKNGILMLVPDYQTFKYTLNIIDPLTLVRTQEYFESQLGDDS